jgi:N-methylhydantoinase B/oxoprolinase/acetone carboxylase alpha subunit
MSRIDGREAIRLQVMWTRLIAVVEEQARSLMRTAFSATVSEAGDLSAGVFDTEGRMIAQAVTGTPGHVNSMAEAVKHFIAKFPVAGMRPGDHFITNDPWLTSGHLHDVTVVSPAFHRGHAVGLFACTCHQVDIGGLGQGPDARSVYEEGLFIPLSRLARGGAVNEVLIEIIRANVRQPDEVEGDIRSYMTCNALAARRLASLLDEYSTIPIERLAAFVFERSRAATLAAIGALPRGTYRNRMTIDGYDAPVELVAALTISEDGIDLDFAGSSPASPNGINLVLNYTKAYAAFGVRCAVAPEVPNNAATLAPIRITAPAGSILNVEHPAPVCARHIIGMFLPDLVLGCLAPVMPGRIPAEGASCVWGLQLRGGPEIAAPVRPARNAPALRYDVLFFNSGGAGARPSHDGLSATAFPSGIRALPIEAVEQVAPIVIWRKELLADSGGAGARRGGLGQRVEVGAVDGAPFAVFAMFDRVANAARGREGGGAGAPGAVRLDDGAILAAKGKQIVPAERRLVVDLPGGAGHGDPHRRPVEAVAADLAAGLIGAEAAAAVYGVAVAPDGRISELPARKKT